MERGQADKQDRLGKYLLLERLGQGGAGEVWKARDTQLQRYVAIKLLRTDLQTNADFKAYFVREARLVAALRHPNIVQIHDFQFTSARGEENQAYMVMDYIEGGTLANAIQRTVRERIFWSASEIVDLFAAISLALDYAHGQRMIHRDIKPANILLDRTLSTGHALGEPILTDFGIARWQGSGSTVTGFVGTPLYSSPEQARSRPVDARSDLYSLGIILYEVLTGTTPFHGDSPVAVMLQHIEEPPPPPALINPLVTPALSAVVLQSISKDPQKRFPSAAAMTIALAQAFHLPVPASLLPASEAGYALADRYNPLQPLQPHSSGTPIPPAFTPPPLIFTPLSENGPASTLPAYDANRMTPPANEITLLASSAGISSAPPQSAAASHPTSAVAPPLPPLPNVHRQATPFPRRWLLALSLGCVALLLLGLGAVIAVSHLSSSSAPPTTGAAVSGQILFLRSPTAAKGIFDELRIDLNNVSPPGNGQVYYAWLMQANSEALNVPHWSLQVNSGAIHDLYPGLSPQTDLYAASTLFLITAEDAGSTPIVPYPSPAEHFYYAIITHTSASSPSFTVKNCPTSDINSASNPCR